MSLTINISNEEVSSNPATGKVTGDADPTVTQDGVLTKFRGSQDELKAVLDALKAIWDGHNHDPATGTGGGGRPIGTGGARSIAPRAVIEQLIADLDVTDDKTAEDAITTPIIEDESVERAQLGAPTARSRSMGPGESWTITHGRGFRVLRHVECDDSTGEFVTVDSEGANSFTVKTSAFSSLTVTVTVRYWG